MEQLQNGKIKRTMLGREDHGIMTFMLHIDYGGSGRGVGGYGLGDHRDGHNDSGYGTAIISRILEVVDVMTWEELRGKHIRVVKADDSFQAQVLGIQNICTDERVMFKEFAAKYSNDK